MNPPRAAGRHIARPDTFRHFQPPLFASFKVVAGRESWQALGWPTMTKVTAQMSVSLDGFYAGRRFEALIRGSAGSRRVADRLGFRPRFEPRRRGDGVAVARDPVGDG